MIEASCHAALDRIRPRNVRIQACKEQDEKVQNAGKFHGRRKMAASFITLGNGGKKKIRLPKLFCDRETGLFRGGYNRDAPWPVAHFDAAKFLARFYVDDRDII